MRRNDRVSIALIAACLPLGVAAAATPPATLILRNADIWTVDKQRPTAQALAVAGNRIVHVGTEKEAMRLHGPQTQVMDLQGAFVLPGFNDSHTHFGNAVAAFFEVRAVDVNDQALLLQRLQVAAQAVPKGMWITAHGWAASAAAAAKRRGESNFQPLIPELAAIDRITPDHPVLLRRYDGAYFINSAGFRLAHIDKHTPDPTNGEYVRDPQTGELTGLLLGTAGERMAEIMPPQSRARELIAARAVLRDLRSNGITSIHDIARVDAISQTKLYRTDVERSTSELSLFTDLRARGELTVRVFAILTMANWRDYAAHGIAPGGGDDFIRYGALKSFIDGFAMSQPFSNNPRFAGGFSFRVVNEQTLRDEIVGSDAIGFDSAVHVTGDRAQRMLLDWYEDAIRTNPARDRRFRIIHAWYPAREDVQRAGKIGAIADIQPYHLTRELGEVEHKLGAQRAAFAFPWRTMIDSGMRISLGSDWPGSFDRSNVAPLNPLEIIYYAVTRQRLDGTPAGGFLPAQALTIDEAIQAYTLNPGYGAREEAIKGSISVGKLADLVVLSKNIRRIPPQEIPATRVLHTILDGRLVYSHDSGR
jgi:predicted amidohydrolase YtcJ